MSNTYKLKQPLLGWAKGEHFTFDPEWNEWTRKKTGETFNYRGTIGEGEKAMLLFALKSNDMTTILEATDLSGEHDASQRASSDNFHKNIRSK